jgi:hypothetical protein
VRRTLLSLAAMALTGLAAALTAARPAAAELPATQLYYPEVVSPGQSFPVRLHYAKPNGDINFDCASQHATGYWDGQQVTSITPTNSGLACDALYTVAGAKVTTAGSHTVRVAVNGGPALSGSVSVKGAATKAATPAPKPSRTTPKPAVASAVASAPATPAAVASASATEPSATDTSPVMEPSPSARAVTASNGNGRRHDEGYAAGGVGLAGVLTGLGVVLVRRRNRRTQPEDGTA